MMQALALVPLPPLLGFLVLAWGGRRLRRRASLGVGAASVGLSAVAAGIAAAGYLAAPPAGGAYRLLIWRWMDVEGFSPGISFYLDGISLLMMLVVTGVGFLIHLYSTEYMR